MEDERLKNYRAIDQLAEEFLSLPVIEISEPEPPQTERYFHLVNIAEKLGSGSYDHVELIRLFVALESKACKYINQLIALSHTNNLPSLKESGLLDMVDSKLIDATEKQHEDIQKKQDAVHTTKRSEAAYKGHQRTEISQIRKNIKSEFEDWKNNRTYLYKSYDEFATEMLKKYPDSSHSTITGKWCVSWNKELKSKN